MSLEYNNKLKNLLEQWPAGFVATSPWLKSLSISSQLIQKYLKRGWIQPLGRGAYKKAKDEVAWYGALASIQEQLSLPIHLGGPTALGVDGSAHYIRSGRERVFLFSDINQKLPKWFKEQNWGNPVEHVRSSFLSENFAIKKHEYHGITFEISSRERAIFECLYLSPKRFDLLECYQLLETLYDIRPEVVQKLLAECNSVRVKRLFLYMAKKAKLPVLNHLDLQNIDLGTGDRSIANQGVYIAEFQISIPKELAEYV